MIFGHDGSLWQTNFGGGVTRIGRLSSSDGTPVIERFMPEDGLTSPVAVPVLEDREGNIWIGTNVGLNRLRPVSAVTVLRLGEGPARTFRLSPASDGIVYVASGRILYRAVPGRDIKLLQTLPDPIRFLQADGKDLVIGQGNSVLRLTKGRLVRPRYPPALSEIASWGKDARGQIWITADNIGGFRLSPNGWVAASFADQELAGKFAFSHTVTKSGDWLYAQDHLLRRVGPVFETVSTKGPALGHITIVSEGRAGLLVGGELGLARLRGPHFQTISTAREPALRGISGIVQTPDCDVWINGVRGLLRTSCHDLKTAFDNPGKRLRYKQFSAADGLPGVAQQNGDGSTLARGGDGRIWIANNLGVAWIDPARTIANRLPPPVQIRTLEANGQVFADVDRVELPPGTQNLRIGYTAPSLAASEKISFRYRLIGVDRDWVDAGTRRDAFYANLPAGEWQFQVIAANNDGVWNKQGDSLAISIAPQFYETTWFRLLCIVLVLATVWLLYNWRVRQHRSHARDVAEAQLGERERIARELHDTLLQGVQGLMLRFQAATNAMSPGSREHVLAERALEKADDLIIQARDRVRGLRASERSGELVSLMEELAAQYRSDGLSVAISSDDRLEPLAPELTEQVLAIVAEALANILHHAQASEVRIQVDRGHTHLKVAITDDGIGFPMEVIANSGRPGHFGIRGMAERANSFGGWLRIDNSADLGAQIIFCIPAAAEVAMTQSELSDGNNAKKTDV
jgi:signal transduction histidine kinase